MTYTKDTPFREIPLTQGEIRELRRLGATIRGLAARFGVREGAIYDVLARRMYRTLVAEPSCANGSPVEE